MAPRGRGGKSNLERMREMREQEFARRQQAVEQEQAREQAEQAGDPPCNGPDCAVPLRKPTRGPRPDYCSGACRQKAYRERKKARKRRRGG